MGRIYYGRAKKSPDWISFSYTASPEAAISQERYRPGDVV